MTSNRITNAGYSLLEFIFAVVIATIIVFVITIFAKDIISINASTQSSMNALFESRKILSVMVAELRSNVPSALGSYPIETAATNTLIFFADTNSDDVADRIRYFLDSATNSLKRGVVLALGEPPAYDLNSETISILATDIYNGTSTALFDYYDGNYAGTTSPLSLPINIQAVRLVKITVKIERDPNRGPNLVTFTSQAALRNLKDNL